MKNFVTTNKVNNRIMIIMTIKVLSPQNQIDNIIQLSGTDSFLFTKRIGIVKMIVNVTNILLTLSLCSWGVIEATLIKKISNPPINTIT